MSVVQLQDLIHVSSWNMFVTAKGERVVALSKGRLYGRLFFLETTITGIVYLNMLQQFLIPQTIMTKKDAFTSSRTALRLITLEKCASTSAPVSRSVDW
jgi:hypothetical protein